MLFFDAYRIICLIATNAGAGQTRRGQVEPEVDLQVHALNLARDDQS